MKTLVAMLAVLSLAGSAAAQEATVDYRFDEVKNKVTLTKARHERRVETGQHAQSGDEVQTGWFSYALIASVSHRAKFEIFSSTDVQLAAGTPGVILSLERGRLRAVFDKLTGNEPRVVETPGALLAVRGTQYDIEVDSAGKTRLDVWEGTVEVRSKLRRAPLLVHAGQESIFSRREAPEVWPMPEDRRKNAPAPRDDADHAGHDQHAEGAKGDPRGTPPDTDGGHPPPTSHGSAHPPKPGGSS